MKTIEFTEISKYFERLLYTITQELYENDMIKEQFKFNVFTNTGEYMKKVAEPYTMNEDQPVKEVLVNIKNTGGVQDSSISIDTYLQLVSFEFFAFEEQRDDLSAVLTKLCAEYKTKLDSIDDSTVNIIISDYPTYSGMIEAEGEHKFTATFDSSVIVFTNATLSNIFAIDIDGVTVYYNTMSVNRSTELAADLQKRTTTLFYPNTTGLQVGINGLFTTNTALQTLFNDCISNNRFNIPYTIVIKKYDSNTVEFMNLMSNSFYVKDCTFNFTYGSIVSYNIIFYSGLVL